MQIDPAGVPEQNYSGCGGVKNCLDSGSATHVLMMPYIFLFYLGRRRRKIEKNLAGVNL
jgi:hypothetical protein